MLRNRWYPLLETEKLRRKPIEIKRMGKSLALWRDAENQPRLMAGACPHRAQQLAAQAAKASEPATPRQVSLAR